MGGLLAARVIEEQKGLYRLALENGDRWASVSGRLRSASDSADEMPAVGDWVLTDPGTPLDQSVIRAVLRRKSAIVRGRFDSKRQGDGYAGQVLAANVDTVFVVESLGVAPNFHRIDRFLALAHEGGAWPVILLNKADLAENSETVVLETEARHPGVDVIPVSSVSGQGLERLSPYLGPGKTVVQLGPSGVGKSTLINRLLGRPVQEVGEVRDSDGKGRHTTTSRQLLALPDGQGLIIDTPGLRAVGLTSGEEGLASAFADVEALAEQCRFRDCTHGSEPGCALREALVDGTLNADRLESYLGLQHETRRRRELKDPVSRKKEGRRMARMISEVKRQDKRRFER
ncbi:MAG: ribosome small subunit-dependent GTPase A [Proteobacteria bacterium]|nr:ribosome small subunit-dependent GTPase A [Pseudomonadota bacterium]